MGNSDSVKRILEAVRDTSGPAPRPGKPRDTPLSTGDGSLITRALSLYTLGEAIYGGAKAYVEVNKRKRTYSVTVRSDDAFYLDVQDWLLREVEPVKVKSLVVKSRYHPRSMYLEDDDSIPPQAQLILSYNDNVPQHVIIEGQRVTVTVHKAGESNKSESGLRLHNPRPIDDIVFKCRSQESQTAVIRLLERLVQAKRGDKPPALYMLNSAWNWTHRSDLPPRSLDTVVLAPGQADRLVADLTRFLAAENRYGLLGLPWHRGYLFYGPPGTGKTSAARALATHLGLDLWYAPLREVKGDGNLMGLLGEVRPRSMLLLEDIDSHPAFNGEPTYGDGVSISGLLNALDGVGTPHGLITVLTTNHPERLTDAVMRPGRVDYMEEFGLLSPQGTRQLFRVIYGREPRSSFWSASWTPAQVVEVCKRHLDDPEAAESALDEKLSELAHD